MCKLDSAIEAKIKERQELVRMMEELKDEIASIEDEIKEAMGSEEMAIAGQYKVTYKTTTRRTLDSAGLKELLGDALEPYTKVSTFRTFKIA